MVSLIIEYLILDKLNMMSGVVMVLYIIECIVWFIRLLVNMIKTGLKLGS